MRAEPLSPGPSALILKTKTFVGSPSTFSVATENCPEVSCAITDALPQKRMAAIIHDFTLFIILTMIDGATLYIIFGLEGKGVGTHLLYHCQKTVGTGGREVLAEANLLDEVEVGIEDFLWGMVAEHTDEQ